MIALLLIIFCVFLCIAARRAPRDLGGSGVPQTRAPAVNRSGVAQTRPEKQPKTDPKQSKRKTTAKRHQKKNKGATKPHRKDIQKGAKPAKILENRPFSGPPPPNLYAHP